MHETSGKANRAAGSTAIRFAGLLAGNAALALGPWFVRMADTGPIAAAFWRLFLPIPLIAIFAWSTRSRGTASRGMILLVMGAAVFFALDLASWHVGIERTRLGNATLFGNAGSVILMIWGLVALRRMPNGREASGVAAALAGAAILLARSLDISTTNLVGDLFCLVAGICYAFYLLPAQKARATLGAWSVLFLVCVTGAPVLLLFAMLAGEPVWPGAAGWTPVLGLALSSQIIGQGLLVYSLRQFTPLIIGMTLLTQPAIAAVIGWTVFGEVLQFVDVAGMALLAAALVFARPAAVPRRPSG